MGKNMAKEKKDNILNLFLKRNEIQTRDEFEEIKIMMQEECCKGDLKLLEIQLYKVIAIEPEGILFKIIQIGRHPLYKVNQIMNKLIVLVLIKYLIKYIQLIVSLSSSKYNQSGSVSLFFKKSKRMSIYIRTHQNQLDIR